MTNADGNAHPDEIGAYRILEQLGEGGMATVYLAEQAEPVKRHVALKILKPGMDSKQIVARFESERQALAVLDHPNIAKIYDGGIAENGRPYFVMEHVRGMPITQFCDKHRLGTAERIRLFIDVCHAVQHAHLKGLIHRDLKPSNILVGVADDDPRPKVIDFGVAKAIEASLTEATLETRVGQFVGTPQYMSPEQTGLTGVDVDTRADIYSLGVVLYELLVGALPLDLSAVRDIALPSVIRDKIPPKPSTKFSSLGATRDDIAIARATSSRELCRQLEGDLDWVVMKAIEKDRTRRYETVNGLARDCEHYLNNEPVLARPPHPGYLLRRFVRRNRVVVAAASVAVLAVVTGAVAATAGYLRATDAEQAARREAETSRQVSEFLVDLFEVSDPSQARGNDITAREVLDRGVVSVNEELENEPAVRATLKTTMGSVYRNLGLLAEAEKLFREALETRTRMLGNDHPDTLTSANWLSVVLLEQGRLEEAAAIDEETLDRRRRVLGDRHPDTLKSIHNLAVQRRFNSELAAAEPLFDEALAGQREVLGDDHPETLLTMTNLGNLYRDMGRHDEARTLLEEALEIQRRAFGADHPQTLLTANNLADLYYDMGMFEEAEPLNVAVLEGRKRIFGTDNGQTLWSMDRLASLYTAQGRFAEAEPLQREAAEGLRRVYGSEHPDTLASIGNLAELYSTQGRFREAEPLYLEVLETQMRLNPDSINAGITSHNLACLYRDTGRHEKAQSMFEQAERIWNASLPPDHPFFIENDIQWAALRRETGDEGGAAELEVRARGPGD